MAKTSLDLVKDKEKELQTLYERMDNDAKLAYLDPFTLKYKDDFGKEHKIPGAVSVTMPDPAVFLNAIISWLLASRWQTLVEGDIPGKQKTLIEGFLDDAYLEADERRVRRGLHKVFPFLATHICARGRIGGRWVWQRDGDNVYLDALPVDMRHVPYETDKSGFKWVGNKTFRSKESIEEEYDITVKEGSDIEVVEFWDDKKNEIWIDEKLIDSRPNTIGYPPFVIVAAPEGFMLLDKGYMVHEGESVFFLGRDIYKSFNQIISIEQTMALKAAIPSYQKETPSAAPKSEYPGVSGEVMDLPEGHGKYDIIPQSDINMSNRIAHTTIADAVKKVGLSDIDLGTWQRPSPASSLVITEQAEIRNRIQSPRLQALETFYEQSSRMIIDQYIKGAFDSQIGRKGRTTGYSYAKLGDLGKYTISYRSMSRSRKLELANIALSAAARGEVPRDTRVRDIMMAEDPEKMIAQLEAEEAETLDPLLKYIRAFCKLIDVAESLQDDDEKEQKYLEAILLVQTAEALARQRSQPQFQPQQPQVEQPKPDNQLLSMMGGQIGGLGG
jgi:hypothetical protein